MSSLMFGDKSILMSTENNVSKDKLIQSTLLKVTLLRVTQLFTVT